MNANSEPDWLVGFPFLVKHWSQIQKISANYADLIAYDLNADWQAYLKTQQQQTPSVNWFKTLREFRKSRLAYIAYQDILLPVTKHVATMNLVADLADLLIKQAYQLACSEMQQKHGQIVDQQGEVVHLMVYALGKLGSYELNYSSDVDLVFLYRTAGQSDGKRALSAVDYFTRMGQKIIKLLDHFSQDGQVYRVDMRLRPFGTAAPLACSVQALQHYFLDEGRDWERFAWMRSRMICGQQLDAALVNETLLPFIYRRHLDYRVFDALAAIKTQIDAHAKADKHHLKLGRGGIRVIEFIVQSLQLVFGGRQVHLQGHAIHPQFNNLRELNKLTAAAVGCIEQAWLWLRKTENIAQIVDDQATHDYPENPLVREVIARGLGCDNWAAMYAELKAMRAQTVQVFVALFEQDEGSNNHVQHDSVAALMAELPLARMPQSRIELISDILFIAVDMTTDEAVLKALVGLVKKIKTRPSYLMMLQKEQRVLAAVLRLCEREPYFIIQLQKHPVLLEQLFDYETMIDLTSESLAALWSRVNSGLDDVEHWMEATRVFKKEQEFRVMLAWTRDELSDSQACQQLSVLAQFMLKLVVNYSLNEIKNKHPDCKWQSENLIIIAYGSAAGDAMHVNSDLDLVFVLDVQAMNGDDFVLAQKWVKRIMHHLATSLYSGHLYDLDMQLRPNGNSGTLITTCQEFSNYQQQQAWLWEHAAMIKSKPVFATAAQLKWHQNLKTKVLSQKRDADVVDQALADMAEKLNANDAADKAAEFKVLATVLKHASEYQELTVTTKLDVLADTLLESGLLDGDVIDGLIHKKSPIK